MNVTKIMRVIKRGQRERMTRKANTDPNKEESMYYDENHMNLIMLLTFILKIIKLILVILTLSYFFGMGWIIICKLEYHSFIEHKYPTFLYGEDLFLTTFDIEERD